MKDGVEGASLVLGGVASMVGGSLIERASTFGQLGYKEGYE